jgi:hypothetical protein
MFIPNDDESEEHFVQRAADLGLNREIALRTYATWDPKKQTKYSPPGTYEPFEPKNPTKYS